ncbi:MAG: ATP-dependent Clp protease proteolytic subunit [Elusimicrobiales bacterium]
MKAFKLIFPAMLCCAAALPAAAQEQPAKPDGNGPKAAAAPPPSPEQAELTKLTTENQLSDQRLKKKLGQLNSEKEELKAQYELELQRQKSKAAALEAELAAAAAENKLNDEKNKKMMAELAVKLARLKAENDLRAEQQRLEIISDSKEKNEIELEMKRMDLAERRLKFEKLELDNRLAKLNSDLDLRGKKSEWKKESNTEPVYADKPFHGRKLVVSDRRIALNGPIFTGVADYVTERIHYYNNISTQPIFIVIDMSPGGSVMEGYRILKAMQASRAPIHVVVKSFAASMAAIITTLADKSYIYPNAIMLHHQMSTFVWGNMTQLKEQLELAKEWERRLWIPLSQKMGVSPDTLRKKLYEKNSDGDWEEFGDRAVELKWAGSVVDEIEETGIVKDPNEKGPTKPANRIPGLELEEKADEKGQRYVSLPRLEPFDFYFIYNPDRYYR